MENQKLKNMSKSMEHKIGKKRKFRSRGRSRSINKIIKNKKIKHHNPMFTHINEKSHFIYDNDFADDYLNRVKNKNLIKLNDEEIKILKNEIEKLDFEKIKAKSENIIFIKKSLANDIQNYFKIETNNNKIKNFLLNEIKANKNRNDFSLRKLSEKYKNITGKYASKSNIHNCLRNQMGFRYLKSIVKINKILEVKNIINSLAFLKTFIKCLKLNFNIIYLDESAIQNDNNNYYSWRFPNEDLFAKIDPKKRLNLIMSINAEKIIYYEINKINTDESVFLCFMDKLKNELLK